MSSEGPQISILDARLAEIDDRLRTIQGGLTDESPAPEPAAWPVRLASADDVLAEDALADEARGDDVLADDVLADDVLADLRALAATQERLLHSVRELLRAHEPAAASADPGLGLSIGPLRSPEELRAFESALADLPAVDAVQLRGYEGGDRAVLEVQLRPTS